MRKEAIGRFTIKVENGKVDPISLTKRDAVALFDNPPREDYVKWPHPMSGVLGWVVQSFVNTKRVVKY